MNVLAIVGSPRKGRSTDILVDQAVAGLKAEEPDCTVKKIHLMDHDIQFCKNCLACRDSKTREPIAPCTIKDGMDPIKQDVLDADRLIFGTPVHMGYATAVMMAFLERLCWTFGKPERNVLTVKGCPLPRSDKKRKAIIIVTSGIIPPHYRKLCDWATGQIKTVVKDCLNGKVVGSLYAGAIENRGADRYYGKAFKLGRRIAG